jgi:hypothetical protein
MRASFPFIGFLLAPFFVVAQTIDFNQNRTFATVADRLVRGPDCQGLVGTNYVAQLYYEMFEGATSLTPVAQFNRFRNVPPTDPLAGTWVGATRTLTGRVSGDNVTLQVYVWDMNAGATFDQARAAGGWSGQSLTFTYTVPAPGSLPSSFYIENFRGVAPLTCPEPSTVTLGVLGVIGLLALQRLRHAKRRS